MIEPIVISPYPGADKSAIPLVIFPETEADSDPLGSDTNLRTDEEQDAGEGRLFTKYELQDFGGELMPNERVAMCMKHRISVDSPVQVLYNQETGHSTYSNLMRCGSVWMCPVCAAKISEERRIELNERIKYWKLNGNSVALVTLTMQHASSESCEAVLKPLLGSLSDFWRFREGQNIQNDFNIIGKIRSIEPLLGENGWHNHFHIVLFIEGDTVDSEAIEKRMTNHWQHVLELNGRYADAEHGCTVTYNNADIADYVNKLGKEDYSWSIAHELVNSHKKYYTNGSLTPMNLLAGAAFGEKFAADKWVEYATAFKGTQQLHYSKGLKDILDALIPDDEAENEADEVEPLVMAVIRIEAWRKIIQMGLRGQVLGVASRGDTWQLLEFLEDMGLTRDIYYPPLDDDPRYIGRALL